jgi:hypothetical protein
MEKKNNDTGVRQDGIVPCDAPVDNSNSVEQIEARVSWIVRADVECPKCEHVLDFMCEDEWWVFCKVAQNVERFKIPYEMVCSKCNTTIKVVGSDY